MCNQSLRDLVQMKVNNDDELKPHEHIIMYDWIEGDNHWKWILTEPNPVILDWVQSFKEEE